jgi:deoxyribodipyrimidine photo-lyase
MGTLVWFRNDLRLRDNPALYHACERGSVVGVFFICEAQWREHDVGDNRLAFLLDCLHALRRDLEKHGIPLRIERAAHFSDVPAKIVDLATALDLHRIAFNEEYPLNEKKRDSRVIRACSAAGIEPDVYHAATILPPGSVLTANGDPYTMFTPFKRRWLTQVNASSLESLGLPRRQAGTACASSALPQRIDGIDRGRVANRFPGGEAEARRRLKAFMAGPSRRYESDRDFPDLNGTSGLSAYLSVGAISPRQCLSAAAHNNGGRMGDGDAGICAWINELIWRDFYRHVVALFPHVSRGQAFRPEADRVAWRRSAEDLAAWQQGRTGYPLVDAGMRQLNETGWMHNRLRMVTAMFLSKHLLLDWRLGERYFMNQLVDGDFAANNGGWQWSASTGTDAAPYFRIFNPSTQAKRFDPQGGFIRRWIPELQSVPLKNLFNLEKHSVPDYPKPMVEHAAARQRALNAFKSLKK